MAHLVRRKRKNPASNNTETYYLLQERGREALALGFVDQKTANDALTIYKADLLREKRAGRPATTSPVSLVYAALKPKVPTLSEWWGLVDEPWPTWPACDLLTWLKAQGKENKGLRTWDDSRRALNPHVGHLTLDAITVKVGDELVARFRADGYADRTLQIRMGHLQGALDAAVEYGKLAGAPKLHRPALRDRRRQVWATPEQARALVQALRERREAGIIDTLSELAIVVGLTLGLRPGELLSRRWSDIVWADRAILVRPVELPDGGMWRPKTERAERTVPVPAELLALLREEWMRQGRGGGWIFPATNNPAWPRASYRKALKSACIAAGLPENLHPHSLRHSAATATAWAGASIRDLMDLFGWSSERMASDVYVHTTGSRLRDLMQAASPLADHAPLTSASAEDFTAEPETRKPALAPGF